MWLFAAVLAGLVCLEKGTVAGLQLSQLPQHPDAACAFQHLQESWRSCTSAATVSAQCCSQLDSAYAQGPGLGCLCLPQVLYATIAEAFKVGLEPLTILHSCSRQFASFGTEWATADNTSCPSIPFGADASDLLFHYGSEAVLPQGTGSGPRRAWSVHNMLQFVEIRGPPEPRAYIQMFWGARTLQLTYLVMLCAPLVFMAAHAALMQLSAAYVAMGRAERMVACQLTVYSVVFGVLSVPQSVIVARAFFGAWSGAFLASSQLTILTGVFLPSRAVLYVAEACVCSVCLERTALLLLHHVSALAFMAVGFTSQHGGVIAVGLLLDLFAGYQWPVYLTRLACRLRWRLSLSHAIWCFACVWGVLTGLLRTVLLAFLFARLAAMPSLHSPAFTFCCVATGLLSIEQAHVSHKFMRSGARMLAQKAPAGAAASWTGCGAVDGKKAGVYVAGDTSPSLIK